MTASPSSSGTPAHLLTLAAIVDERLRSLLRAEQDEWTAIDGRLEEVFIELTRIGRGGKRLRAAFCCWGWAGGAGQNSLEAASEAGAEHVLDAATAFELLQTFALIHDDIMDDAATRRGEQTIHAAQSARAEAQSWRGESRRYGEGVALLIGDLSHVYADRLIGNASAQTRQIWDRLRIELNLGQYLDMRSAAAAQLDETTARRVATFKSALYTIVRPLQLGATLAGPVDETVMSQLQAYGVPAGQAFQLKDDLLGILGDPRTVGKPVGHDLREGKPTELLAIAIDRASRAQTEILAEVGRPDLGPDEIAGIVTVLHEVGAIDEIDRRIDELVATSIMAADQLPFTSEVISGLIDLAQYVADRHH